MDHLQYQIALTLAPQIGAVTARTLVRHCGSAEAVFRAGKKELQRIPNIGPATIAALQSPAEPLSRAEKELYFMEKHGVDAVFFTDPRYPARLRQCADAPALFYFKGAGLSLLDEPRILAIVGTRKPSDHGKVLCEEIVEGLLPYKVLIVSGLAFGVDVTAHRKSNALQQPNIGVLGHGLGCIYPHQHLGVAIKMAELGGLVSEYPHDAKPDREHFPMRNRIISGLSDAVLVVESGESGGSMITVDCAERHGREVFAVPGRPHDPLSVGCNYLIKNERAKLVASAADIAAKMGWDEPQRPKNRQTRLFPELNTVENRLVEIIRQNPEIAVDELTQKARISPGELASTILALEFKGIVRTLPGKRYIVTT
jgi:DNA processing protein